MPKLKKKLAHKIGLGFLLIPTGFLLLFTFGEVFAGDLSGFSHLLQLLPVVLLGVLAWKKPSWAGWLFVGFGVLFGCLYAVRVPFELITIIFVELFLFIPPLLAGLFLVYAGRATKSPK